MKDKPHYRIIGIIPARYDSTRFPGKVLGDIYNKTMLQWVYERSKKAKKLNWLAIATDDKRIQEEAERFGATVLKTSRKHKTGTERVAEAVKDINCDIVLNIQADEPLISFRAINKLCSSMLQDKDLNVSTLASVVSFYDPLVKSLDSVKIVVDKNDFALYFSHQPVPYSRDRIPHTFLIHIGVYAFRKDFLYKFISFKKSRLEETEKLEQLRILENNYKIKVVKTKYPTVSVDTPKDLENVRKIFKSIK
jgi:3-deoxy-manno-octulosonate cytidylyltransferase (CMP-KDO synthetase)